MPYVYASYEKARVDKKVCVKKLVKANEALEQYMGLEKLPSQKSAGENATEASIKAGKAVKLMINQ